MQTKDYLQYIVEKIHSTVFATVDGEGRPVTCAIDMMDYDESGLYFLTEKGKNFYDRLKSNENIACTAMKGEDTLSCVAVSVQGKAKEIGPDSLPELFHKNPKGYYYWLKQERRIQKKPRWQMNLNFYAELHERLKFSGLWAVMGAAALEGAVLYGLHRLFKRVKKLG